MNGTDAATEFNDTLDFQLRSGGGGPAANAVCICLCLASIALNAYVLGALAVHRRRAFKNVFYLLVFHCAFVDLLRASLLLVWFLPEAELFPIGAGTYFRLTKAKQALLIGLRSLNMLTVLNLLVFTMNEFILVKRPLQYRRMVRRRMVLLLLLLSWLLSFAFGLGSVLTRNYSPSGLMIRRNVSLETLLNSSEFRERITRQKRDELEEPLQYAFIFLVIVVCGVCLLSVLTCYAQIMRRIRRFHQCDFRSLNSDSLRIRGSISSRGSVSNERKRRLQAILRHKYLLVIGLVLLVDILFLVPYSFIQVSQYVNLFGGDSPPWTGWMQSRWILQLLIALHSVLQPVCYFRMEDFRRLASCQKLPARESTTRILTTIPQKPSFDLDLGALTEDEDLLVMVSLSTPTADSRALLKAKLQHSRSVDSAHYLLTRL